MFSKKRIAIYGGSFNPPTDAHQHIARYVAENCKVDEVWVMPCGDHTHKDTLVHWSHRLMMCHYAFDPINKVQVMPHECMLETKGSTLDLYNKLNEMKPYKNYDFYFVIGQDNAESIKSWVNPEQVIEKLKFIVFPRGDEHPSKFSWFLIKPHRFLRKFPITNLSSSIVREKLETYFNASTDGMKDKIFLDHLIHYLNRNVWEYITENKLYGFKY